MAPRSGNPQGPLGVETYMVALGPDRAVREVRQVLSDETISKLHVGMSRDEVAGCSADPGHWLFRFQRRRDMVLALSRVGRPQHGALRPVRQA